MESPRLLKRGKDMLNRETGPKSYNIIHESLLEQEYSPRYGRSRVSASLFSIITTHSKGDAPYPRTGLGTLLPATLGTGEINAKHLTGMRRGGRAKPREQVQGRSRSTDMASVVGYPGRRLQRQARAGVVKGDGLDESGRMVKRLGNSHILAEGRPHMLLSDTGSGRRGVSHLP